MHRWCDFRVFLITGENCGLDRPYQPHLEFGKSPCDSPFELPYIVWISFMEKTECKNTYVSPGFRLTTPQGFSKNDSVVKVFQTYCVII